MNEPSKGLTACSRCLLLGVICLFTVPAQSMEFGASLNYGAYYTNNANLTEDDTVDEWVQEPGFNVTASQDTASLQMDAAYSYQRRIYEEDQYSDENVTTGTGSVIWAVIPNRLDFTAQNTRSWSTRRSQGTTNPDNLQVVSNSEAGPTLRFQPRQGDELQIGYRFSRDVRDSTNNDSQRNNWNTSYRLGLSPNRGFILQGNYSDIKYDNSPDADQASATLGYQQTSDSVDFDVSAGYSDFQRDDQDSVNGGIYAASLTWRQSGSTSFNFTANRSIQDQSNLFYDNPDFDDPIIEDSDSNAVYTLTDGGFNWNQELGARTSFTLGAYASDEDYDSEEQDNTRYGVRLSLDRELTRTTTLQTSIDYSNSDYDLGDDNQDEYRARFNVNHTLGRALTLSWGAEYTDRKADATQSYDETRFNINLSYQVLGTRDR